MLVFFIYLKYNKRMICKKLKFMLLCIHNKFTKIEIFIFEGGEIVSIILKGIF